MNQVQFSRLDLFNPFNVRIGSNRVKLDKEIIYLLNRLNQVGLDKQVIRLSNMLNRSSQVRLAGYPFNKQVKWVELDYLFIKWMGFIFQIIIHSTNGLDSDQDFSDPIRI